MFTFKRPADTVFQALLRTSIDYALGFIESEGFGQEWININFKNSAKLFPLPVAKTTLSNLLRCLDRPELYQLSAFHNLLLYDVLDSYIVVTSDLIALEKDAEERKRLSFVDPFYIEEIEMMDIEDMYFSEYGVTLEADDRLDCLRELRQKFNGDTSWLADGLLPYPEELVMPVIYDKKAIDFYRVRPSEFFGPNSKVYPDIDYYEQLHPERSA
jgi:hypothetical protein